MTEAKTTKKRSLFIKTLLVAGLVVLIYGGIKLAQYIKPSQNSLADETFAAIYIKPEKLKQTILANDHAISSLLPGQFSLGRMRNLPLDEVLIAVNRCNEFKSLFKKNLASRFDFLVEARLNQEISESEIVQLWHESILNPESEQRPAAETIEVANKSCFSFPSGTFLPPKHLLGVLEFIDAKGSRMNRGVNVGRVFDHRGFFAGEDPIATGQPIAGESGTKQKGAVITFNGLTPEVLTDEELVVHCNLSVEVLANLDKEFPDTEIFLQNPNNGKRSQKIVIPANSYVDQKVRFPRVAKVFDGESELPQADIFDELVVGGQLEVVLKGRHSGVFYGVDDQDVAICLPQREFLYVEQKRIYLASNISDMEKLLGDSNYLDSFVGDSIDQQAAFSITHYCGPQSVDLTGKILREFSLSKIGFDFGSFPGLISLNVYPDDLDNLLSIEFERLGTSDLADLKGKLNDYAWRLQREIADRIRNSQSQEFMISLAFDGIPLHQYRSTETPSVMTRSHRIISELESGFETGIKNGKGHIDFSLPESLRKLSRQDQDILAYVDEILARKYFGLEWFDSSIQASDRVNESRQADATAIYRLAHHYAFNQFREFNDLGIRYACLRKGLDLVLGHLEKNPDSIDSLAMMGFILGTKLGRSKDAEHLTKAFENDVELLHRINRFVDLKKTRNGDGSLEPNLIQAQIFELCIARVQSENANSRIRDWILISQPAFCISEQAIKLDQKGKFEEAAIAWRKARRMYLRLKRKLAELPTTTLMVSNSLEVYARGDYVKVPKGTLVRGGYKDWTQIDYWIARCRVEVLRDVRQARQLMYKAKSLVDKKEKLKLMTESMNHLTDAFVVNPDDFELTIGEFLGIANAFQSSFAYERSKLKKTSNMLIDVILQFPSRPKRSVLTGSYIAPLKLYLPE